MDAKLLLLHHEEDQLLLKSAPRERGHPGCRLNGRVGALPSQNIGSLPTNPESEAPTRKPGFTLVRSDGSSPDFSSRTALRALKAVTGSPGLGDNLVAVHGVEHGQPG